MREIVHIQAGQCGNQIGAKVIYIFISIDKECATVFSVHTVPKRKIPAFAIPASPPCSPLC